MMNVLSDLWDGTELEPQPPLLHPLYPALVRADAASYVLQERLLSWSGEDYYVKDAGGQVVLRIAGANLNLGVAVIDKVGLCAPSGEQFASVERRILSPTTAYGIYHEGRFVAKIERHFFSWTRTYSFAYADDSDNGRAAGTLRAEGSFSQRKYTIKNGKGATVARIGRMRELFGDVDQYAVNVAAGVDAAAVLALALVIDEDHDEEIR
jgi:uncharacterized protein YxjI